MHREVATQRSDSRAGEGGRLPAMSQMSRKKRKLPTAQTGGSSKRAEKMPPVLRLKSQKRSNEPKEKQGLHRTSSMRCNYYLISTFFVAIMFTFVLATFSRTTSPICTGAFKVTCFNAQMQSKIFSFGMSVSVFTETALMDPFLTLTVVVTVRAGAVISFRAYSSPRLHVLPETLIICPFSVLTSKGHPMGQQMQVNCFI